MQCWAIITPVYEDGPSFTRLCGELAQLDAGVRFHVIAVDDGSLAEPPGAVQIGAAGLTGEVLRLARNVGHQGAIAVGLAHAAGIEGLAGCIVMDCDGEDQPASIPALLAAVTCAGVDVAVAARAKRSESLTFRAFYQVYRRIFRLLTGQVIGFGNFMVLRPVALKRLAVMHESWTHVASAVIKARLRRAEVPTDRGRRWFGRSKMNFVSLVLHGLRAVMVFKDAVLTRLCMLCALMAGFSVLSIGTAVGLKLAGLATPGWVTTVTGFSLSLFLQTGLLTLIMLVMNGLGRPDSPTAVLANALDHIAGIDPAPAGRSQPAGETRRPQMSGVAG